MRDSSYEFIFPCLATMLVVAFMMFLTGCPPSEDQSSKNRYSVMWGVVGGYQGRLETNSITRNGDTITFRIDRIASHMCNEKVGQVITLTKPWAILDTQAATANIPAEVPR
jgi:hypothetical protein